jgi:hypothetical protein
VPPPKKVKQTDAIFEQLKQVNPEADRADETLRISIDAKATVNIGPFSRRGKSRTKTEAADHDFKPEASLTPFGIFIPRTDDLWIYMTRSKVTSDFIVERDRNIGARADVRRYRWSEPLCGSREHLVQIADDQSCCRYRTSGPHEPVTQRLSKRCPEVQKHCSDVRKHRLHIRWRLHGTKSCRTQTPSATSLLYWRRHFATALGHFPPIRPVMPCGSCPLRPTSRPEAGRDSKRRIEAGGTSVIQAPRWGASNHAL